LTHTPMGMRVHICRTRNVKRSMLFVWRPCCWCCCRCSRCGCFDPLRSCLLTMLLPIAFLDEECGVAFGVRILRGVLLGLLWFLGHPYLVAVVVRADYLRGLPRWPCCGWDGGRGRGGGGGAYAVFPLPLHRDPVSTTTSNTNTATIPIEPTSRRGSSTAPLLSTTTSPHTSPGRTASPSRGVTHNTPHLRCWHVDSPSASHVRIRVRVVGRCMWRNRVVVGDVVVIMWLMMLQMLLMVLRVGVRGGVGATQEVSLRGVWSPITINIIAIPIASSR